MDFNDFDNQIFPPEEEIFVAKDNSNESKTTKKYSVITGIVCVLLSSLISVGTTLGVLMKFNQDDPKTNKTDNNQQINNVTQQTTTNINVDETAENVIEAVAKKVTPSVVGISTKTSVQNFFGSTESSGGTGSGVIYSQDGYIITNYHVIEDTLSSSSSIIEVYLSSNTETPYEATVIGYSITHDLAVIKINAKNLPKIDIGDISNVKVGQYVAAIGSPGGLEFMGSVTLGIISGLDRIISDGYSDDGVNLIQTDAAINPGNSGGALVNVKGQLIGINSSKISATEYEGMGFAIPIDVVVEVCDKIISRKDDPNPYIGVTINEKYTGDILERLGYPRGVVIKSVITDSPAYDSGIRSGDIITKFGNVEITDYTKLAPAVADTTPGQTVRVTIYRSGKYYYTDIVIGSNNS